RRARIACSSSGSLTVKTNHNRPTWPSARALALLRGPLCYLATIMILWSCVSMGYSLAAPSSPSSPNAGKSSGSGSGLDFNLSSAEQITTAGKISGFSINVGGVAKQVTSATPLTAAEYIAAVQVLNTGRQPLVVGGTGTATGGYFDMHTLPVA